MVNLLRLVSAIKDKNITGNSSGALPEYWPESAWQPGLNESTDTVAKEVTRVVVDVSFPVMRIK